MKTILEYLKTNTFFIATCEGDQPRVRPFGAAAEFEGKIYIVTNNQKKVFDQMTKNPKIEICAMGKDNTWLRVECKVIHDKRLEARKQMMYENEKILGDMYSADDGLMEVFYLQEATATIYSFTKEPVTIQF